ncbi:MAG: hypothetical protein ABI539_08125 [Acidobacteriota bacterium]
MPEKKSEKCDEADRDLETSEYPSESDTSEAEGYYYDDSHGYEDFKEGPEDQQDLDDDLTKLT